MNLTRLFLLLGLIFSLASPVSAAQDRGVVHLTAAQVDGANDIEAAIITATAGGTRPGIVILDGRDGPFQLLTADRSLNIFVSNLDLRGENHAVIKHCADGIFFDDFPLKHVRVENITFFCDGSGVVAQGAFQEVTLRGNIFQTGAAGITAGGHSSGWLISGNLIRAGADGIHMSGAEKVTIAENHVAARVGISLMACGQVTVRRNAIQSEYLGILLAWESWDNRIQSNTILGVEAAGVALEPGVNGNRIQANHVLCAPAAECLTVDAGLAELETNTLTGNLP